MHSMQARMTTLLARLRNSAVFKSVLQGCRQIQPLLAGLCHQTARQLQRLQYWLALNWPPFRHRLIVLISTVGHESRLLIARVAREAHRFSKLTYRVCAIACRALYGKSLLAYGIIRQLIQQYWPSVRNRLLLYSDLTRLNRPIGILLLLWPTLWALWIAASGLPPLNVLIVFVLGVVLTRSAGCVFNDMTDRKFDRQVRRTAARPLATGKVGTKEALWLACALLLIAFGLVLTLNRLTILLSFIAIPLAVIYPFMKRYTYIPQFFLGLAFSWGIPMAFAAVNETIPPLAWLLYAANILWSVVYDTLYAMVDREDDLKAGVKSTAILFDDADRTIIGILQLMFLLTMILIGIQISAKMIYYAGTGLAAMLMIYHQYQIRHRLPEACFKAFLNNHWVGLSLFAGIYLNYL